MASLPPYALEVSPESSLQFSITQHPQGDGDENNASKCIMTLRHTGATKESLAFKVSLLVIIVMYTSRNGRRFVCLIFCSGRRFGVSGVA